MQHLIVRGRYTKMGYAGNAEPSYIIPSTIAIGGSDSNVRSRQGIEDLDYYIGNEVLRSALFAISIVLYNDS